MSWVAPAAYTNLTVIRFWVRVPVLSVQITVVLPRVSAAGSLRMMACRPAMRDTPIASVMVTAAGSPSGIAPTASATAAVTISAALSPRSNADPEGEGREGDDHAGEPLAEPGQLAGQRGRDAGGLADELMDPADLGLHARADDQAATASGGHQSAGVGHVRAVAQRGRRWQERVLLVDGDRLAGQR